MAYKTVSFMAIIDGAEGKFFEFEATGKEGAIADLKAIYGEETTVEIYLWQVR